MTPERKKYLDGISKVELAIRSELYSKEIRLSDLKWNVKFSPYKDVRTTSLELIKETKSIIQSLKKQLPAPTRFGSCVICGSKQPKGHIRFYSYSYCAECGQKLR